MSLRLIDEHKTEVIDPILRQTKVTSVHVL